MPLIIVTPEMRRGGPAAAAAGKPPPRTVEMLDFYPTLLELAGLAPPATDTLDGVSLVPQLTDPRAPRPRDRPASSVLCRRKTWGKAVYTERYRYTEYGDDAYAGVELYGHEADPHELNNLAADPAHAATARSLKALLEKEIRLRDAVGAAESTRD